MKGLLVPADRDGRRAAAFGVVALLAISAGALLVAPRYMPAGYTPIAHTTSESGAQGLPFAWIARLGFLSFGLAVIWLAGALRYAWAHAARWLHIAFGVLMTATAAFSHRPWIAGVPFDATEDALHSFTATAMGFAFSLGVLASLFQRNLRGEPGRAFDVVALVAATAIPLITSRQPGLDGLIQRIMFLVAYLWYAREALWARRASCAGSSTTSRASPHPRRSR